MTYLPILLLLFFNFLAFQSNFVVLKEKSQNNISK